jgi:hypothetical protein
VYLALTAGPVPVKRADNRPPTRTLAYEQQINGPDHSAPAPQEGAPAPEQTAAPATVEPDAASPETDQAAAAGDNSVAPATEDNPQMAALPRNGEVTISEPGALPWQQRPPETQGETTDGAMPGEQAYGPNGAPEDAYPPDQAAAAPGPDADPNGYPAASEDEPQEWVQVLVSGAGMHGAASQDAPALFAFPYGRALRVVSRYEGWVEVTDPQSAATGWMEAQYLAPIAPPGPPPDAQAMYNDPPPQRRPGWLQRNGGGFADMINRALGGH